jgi:hypothetical protein
MIMPFIRCELEANMIDPKALAQSVLQTVCLTSDEAIVSFHSEHWTEEEIRSFIGYARILASEKSVKLRGVRVNAFMRLGGAQGGSINAQFQKDIPIVQSPTTQPGWVELVFRP